MVTLNVCKSFYLIFQFLSVLSIQFISCSVDPKRVVTHRI